MGWSNGEIKTYTPEQLKRVAKQAKKKSKENNDMHSCQSANGLIVWLKENNLSNYYFLFEEKKIATVKDVRALSDKELQELGLKWVLDLKFKMHCINKIF